MDSKSERVKRSNDVYWFAFVSLISFSTGTPDWLTAEFNQLDKWMGVLLKDRSCLVSFIFKSPLFHFRFHTSYDRVDKNHSSKHRNKSSVCDIRSSMSTSSHKHTGHRNEDSRKMLHPVHIEYEWTSFLFIQCSQWVEPRGTEQRRKWHVMYRIPSVCLLQKKRRVLPLQPSTVHTLKSSSVAYITIAPRGDTPFNSRVNSAPYLSDVYEIGVHVIVCSWLSMGPSLLSVIIVEHRKCAYVCVITDEQQAICSI